MFHISEKSWQAGRNIFCKRSGGVCKLELLEKASFGVNKFGRMEIYYSPSRLQHAIMPIMNPTEANLRTIKDKIAAAIGELEEASIDAAKKENYRRLNNTALELHRCADDLQNILMRIKPRAN
jgi:hypothetical protein